MTREEFLAFYPQFGSAFPEAVLSSVIAASNARFTTLGDMSEEARRLYTAHKLTLWAKTVPPNNSLPSLASAGDGTKITSKKVENVSVTYASAESSSGILRELEGTIFGRQLLLLLKLAFPPTYIPG